LNEPNVIDFGGGDPQLKNYRTHILSSLIKATLIEKDIILESIILNALLQAL